MQSSSGNVGKDETVVHPFDLQARAALGARCLSALLDPRRPGQMYFLVHWRTCPPRADHCLWDCGDGSGRHIDALTLARIMVKQGSPEAVQSEEERAIEGWMLHLLGEHGLSWLPPEPWAEPWGKMLLLVGWREGEQVAEISWAQRGTLLALVSRYRATGAEHYRRLACRMVDGLLQVAVHHPHGLFYPEGYYRLGGWQHQEPGLYPGLEEYNAAVAVSALRLYEATGYEPALALAKGLIEFALYHTRGYTPDGGFRPPQGELEGHFHTRSNFILSVLKLGLAIGHRAYVSWARQSYEHAKSWGTDFGWFPEGLGHRHGEMCGTTDMIEIALLLGRHVDRRYYADAERFGRNHLLESQFLSIEHLAQAVHRLPPSDELPPWAGIYSCFEGVTESQAGGFASRSTLNDAFHLDETAMMQCCNAAGVRALYDLWRYALEESHTDEGMQGMLHLRFSVETPALRVVSHEPSEGQLDITARQDYQMAVRLPDGTTEALVLIRPVTAPPRVHALSVRERYIDFRLSAGETAAVYYPLPERVVSYEVGAAERRLRCLGYWRGETLLRVEPPGEYAPLYQRSRDRLPAQPGLPVAKPIESL